MANKFNLNVKRNSFSGIVSSVLSIISLILFIADIISSLSVTSKDSLAVGFIGVICFFMTLIGFIFGILGFREIDTKKTLTAFGSILNFLLFSFLFYLYIKGFTM